MKKLLFFLILILVLGFFIDIHLPKNFLSEKEIIFIIEKGQGSKEIALNLQEGGLIRWGSVFRAYVFITGVSGELKAGKYQISASMSISEMANKFVRGEIIKEKITIIEGWNLRDIAWYFENKGMFQAEELFELVGFPAIDYSKSSGLPPPNNFNTDYEFLKDKPEIINLEGYLFPDTYELSGGEELEEIVRKMLDNFDKKLTPELRDEIQNQNKTIFKIVTMASLLEKEVKTKEEKELVAGILWKRIEYNIPLQVDATVTYITGKKTTKVSKEETQIDSPYNTYKYRDLPSGPICNPGLESILAALYPKSSEYWYYLSAPAAEGEPRPNGRDGETIFSKTLEEHNIAKAKYLK